MTQLNASLNSLMRRICRILQYKGFESSSSGYTLSDWQDRKDSRAWVVQDIERLSVFLNDSPELSELMKSAQTEYGKTGSWGF